MNTLDIIILIPILFGLIRGLVKGFVNQLSSLVAVVFGVIAAKLYTVQLTQYLLDFMHINSTAAEILSYFLIFIVVVLAITAVGKLFSKLLSTLSLGGIDKALGALFGAIKFALIVSVLLNGFAFFDAKIPLVKPEAKKQSALYLPIKQLAQVAWEHLI